MMSADARLDAALALLWGALDEYAEEDGAVIVVDALPEDAATGDDARYKRFRIIQHAVQGT